VEPETEERERERERERETGELKKERKGHLEESYYLEEMLIA